MNKGQMTIIGILTIFITLIVFSAIMPSMNTAIANATAHTDETADLMLNLIPLFIVIAIIMSIFTYAKPYFQRGNE